MTYDPRRGANPYMDIDDEDALTPAQTDRTVRRPSGAPQRGVAPRSYEDAAAYAAETDSRVLRRPAQQQVPVAAPSPAWDDEYLDPEPSDGVVGSFFSALTSLALLLLAWLLRLGGIAYALVVVGSALLADSHRAMLVHALNLATDLVPAPFVGQFVFETPFGGTFRGDLALVSLALFALDWLCMRYRASLRARRERGA